MSLTHTNTFVLLFQPSLCMLRKEAYDPSVGMKADFDRSSVVRQQTTTAFDMKSPTAYLTPKNTHAPVSPSSANRMSALTSPTMHRHRQCFESRGNEEDELQRREWPPTSPDAPLVSPTSPIVPPSPPRRQQYQQRNADWRSERDLPQRQFMVFYM